MNSKFYSKIYKFFVWSKPEELLTGPYDSVPGIIQIWISTSPQGANKSLTEICQAFEGPFLKKSTVKSINTLSGHSQ